jgi:hypothetical protein
LHHNFNIASAAGCRDLGTLAQRQIHTEITAAGNLQRRGKSMSNGIKNSNDRQGPPAIETREQARVRRERALSLDMEPHSNETALRSSDPYNTSGSFDRTKNWSRVGKR